MNHQMSYRQTLGGYKTIDEYVEAKLARFAQTDKSFGALFEFMFSETDNVLFEKSEGHRIVETTYGQCRDSIERRAYRLRSLLGELPENSVIGLYMNNSREWIEIFWSILLCGHRPMLMNLRLDQKSLENIVKDYKVAAVVADTADATFSAPVICAADTEPGAERIGAGTPGTEVMLPRPSRMSSAGTPMTIAQAAAAMAL